MQLAFQFDNLAAEVEAIGGLIPRDYQQSAIDNAFRLWASGAAGVLCRQPTGSGKTVTGTMMAEKWLSLGRDRRVLVIAHERQLIHQFADEIHDIRGEYPGIEMSAEKVRGTPPITVASRQTLISEDNGEMRLWKFDARKYKWLLILDECHRWAFKLKSCRPILEHFQVNPESKRLGLTATPERTDKTTLAKVFPEIAADYRLFDIDGGKCAVEDGWAVPYDQRFVLAEGVDFKNLRELKGTGDFDPAELETILGEESQLRKLVEPTLDLVGDRRTIIFSATTGMAKAVARCINSYRPDSAVELDGTHGEYHRKDVYRRHQTGAFQFLSVCGLCVAKGTLVLTDRGEVPIERVTTAMKLWDGVEFVEHDGVICKGMRPVVQYAGLIATGDHHVWTDRGWERLAACKQQRIAVRVSAIGGTAVRESCGYYRDDHSTWKESSRRSGSALRRVRHYVPQVLQRIETRPRWVQAMRQKFGCTRLVADALSLCPEAVRESARRILFRLRRSWSGVPLCFSDSNGTMDNGESRTEQGNDDRPNRQPQALRAWKPSVGKSIRAGQEPKTEETRLSSAEVYDILNAGPRHRFTANGLIVSNCREGYNDPGIQAVAVFRPTKSRSLAEQFKGRGCRPLRGCVNSKMTKEERLSAIATSDKPNCMIIDLVGITGMADCASTAHIMAAGLPDEVADRANANALKKNGQVDMGAEVRRARQEIADEERARRRKEREEREAAERAEAERRGKIKSEVKYTAIPVQQGTGARTYSAQGRARGARMPFGKHKGKLMADISSGYLRAVCEGDWCKTPWIRDAAKKELDKRQPHKAAPIRNSIDEINAMLAGAW